MTKLVPEGYHTVTPSVTFKDSQRAIEFYKKAFGAEVLSLFPSPVGKGVMHATIRIGNSILMMADEIFGQACKSAETLGISPISLYIYTQDVDMMFKRALQAGAVETMPVADMFWGDRCGTLADPFGHKWSIATHKEDLTSEEIKRRGRIWMEKQKQPAS